MDFSFINDCGQMIKNTEPEIEKTYTYDKQSRMTKVSEGITARAQYSYDANGNMTGEDKGMALYNTYAYNRDNSVANTMVFSVYNPEGIINYTYYRNGNIKGEDEGQYSGRVVNYEYDGQNRLSRETLLLNNETTQTRYAYDEYGNRASKNETKNSENSVTDYMYDDSNRMMKERRSVSNGDEFTTRYKYDDVGNMILRSHESMTDGTGTGAFSIKEMTAQVDEFTYNGYGEMTGAKVNGVASTYTYRPDGLRAGKTVGGVTTRHVWDGSNIVLDLNGDYSAKMSFTRGIRLVSYKNAAGERSVYNFNVHGDVLGITKDTSGAPARYQYDAFGNQIGDEASENPFRYFGQYTDAETGLIYLRARYYEPAIGQFISEDPARDGMNWYSYCDANPVMFKDLTGKEYIVVSGGAYDTKGGYNYEFVETAIKKLRQLKDLNDGENITWVIANAGWEMSDIDEFRNVAEDMGVNLKFIGSSDELINYINYKNGANRQEDKIKKFALFSHGRSNALLLGMGHSNAEQLQFNKNDIQYLDSNAFENANSIFYSCNTGTGGDQSFAQMWANQTKGKTWAVYGKTTYEHINNGVHPLISASRKLHGFSFWGSANYPVPGVTETNGYKPFMAVFAPQ